MQFGNSYVLPSRSQSEQKFSNKPAASSGPQVLNGLKFEPRVSNSSRLSIAKLSPRPGIGDGIKKKYINSSIDLSLGIFEIYGIGINYTTRSGYGVPYGSGIIITKSLILTTHSNLPTSEHALISIIKFPSRPDLSFRLNPSVFFYTDSSKNITITSISIPANYKYQIIPLLTKFKLYKGALIKIVNTTIPCPVTNISTNGFAFRNIDSILPGTPVFTLKYKVQGIFTHTSSLISCKEAIRIDSVLSTLMTVKNIILHPELSNLIQNHDNINTLPQSGRLGDNQDIYWVQWRSMNIYEYQHISKSWHGLQIVNISQYKLSQKQEFSKSSRLIYINDTSFFVIGGIDYCY